MIIAYNFLMKKMIENVIGFNVLFMD